MTGDMTGNTSRNCDTPTPSSIQRLSVKVWKISLSFCFSLCLMGCKPAASDQPQTTQPQTTQPQTTTSPSTPIVTPTVTSQTKPKPASELAQYLPITATATIADREIQLEVANTPQEREKGLMFRPPLPDDRGMLFPFIPARPVAFWMKNTPSPLDMIFLLDGEVKAIARDVSTCVSDPCPIYPAGGVMADQVIEVRAGLTQEMGLKEGDRINIKFLLPKNQ